MQFACYLAIPSGRLLFNYGRFLFVANRAVLRNDRAGSDRTERTPKSRGVSANIIDREFREIRTPLRKRS